MPAEITIHWMAILKVTMAIILGGFIGLEREIVGKPAGLRTHMLVAGAATLFVLLGKMMIEFFIDDIILQAIQADPIRIIEAIITGISFLGAGTIIFRNKQHTVEGLTTAASILFVAGIGMAVAVNAYWMAIILTILVVLVLQLLTYIERWIDGIHSNNNELS